MQCYKTPSSILHFLIVTAFVLLQCIQNGSAIKCFVCDSSDNPSCEDVKINSSLVAEECTYDKMKSTDTWLFELNRFDYFDTGIRDGPLMNCQKVVAKDPHTSKMVTARFCQLDTADTDACQTLGSKLDWPPELARNANLDKDNNKKKSAKHELHCSICNTDGCNGSQKVRQWHLILIVSVLPALLATKIMLRHSAW